MILSLISSANQFCIPSLIFCLINVFHVDLLIFSAALISTYHVLFTDWITLLQTACSRLYLHCSLTIFFAIHSSSLFNHTVIKHCAALQILLSWPYPCLHQCSWVFMVILGLAVIFWVLCFPFFLFHLIFLSVSLPMLLVHVALQACDAFQKDLASH